MAKFNQELTSRKKRTIKPVKRRSRPAKPPMSPEDAAVQNNMSSAAERMRREREGRESVLGQQQTLGPESIDRNRDLLRRLMSGQQPQVGEPGGPTPKLGPNQANSPRAEYGRRLLEQRQAQTVDNRMGMPETKGPEQLQRQRDLIQGLLNPERAAMEAAASNKRPQIGLSQNRPTDRLSQQPPVPQQPQTGALAQAAAQQQFGIIKPPQQPQQPQSIGPQQQEAQMKAQMYQTKPAEQPPQMAQQPAQQPEESEEEKKRKLQAQQIA